MPDPDFPLMADDEMDDLPRTLRREKAAREREAMGRTDSLGDGRAAPAPELGAPIQPRYGHGAYEEEPLPAEVRRLNIPFLHLMVFFLKAVLAAVPALILLGAIIWGAGEILQNYLPWLVQMKIVILFPE
ncbi:MAG: hypothetical protein APF80_10160 [Alphaproteobacteria bacterium BRH_c36]|nr:MAG: hypothetical protein APF80_10160 [Alphaproteobacteria bacterium BRH_c36]